MFMAQAHGLAMKKVMFNYYYDLDLGKIIMNYGNLFMMDGMKVKIVIQ